MVHLIDKSAIVAEIEKMKSIQLSIFSKGVNEKDCYDALTSISVYNEILSFIDTLEVKKVNLESEIKKIQKEYKTIDEYDGYPATIYASSIEQIAKHFFELGLKVAQKGKEVDLEKDVRQILSLYYEGIKHYEDIIKEEREENGGSDLAIKIMNGVVDARELSIQYVLDKLKAQKL